MAQTQILKRRIRSVGNTRQITKAMELVAAAKMRRVQEAAKSARIYSDTAGDILQKLSRSPETSLNPYFKPPASKAKLYIIFSSDRGLAGAYNANIFNEAARSFAQDKSDSIRPSVIAFGRKAARHFSRGINIEFIGAYENIVDEPDINVFSPVIDTISSGIHAADFSSVVLIFTESISTMVQKVRLLQLVPIVTEQSDSEQPKSSGIEMVYELEPEAEVVIKDALKLYIESALRRARVEAAASEHAMRMISMGNANRNASDLMDDLTLELNATRQATITQEMAEIIGGATAIT